MLLPLALPIKKTMWFIATRRTYQCKEGGLYAPLDVYEDHFVYAMWPYQLKEGLDKVPMLKELLTQESLELMLHLEDEDNPVVMLYRLKDLH